MQYFSCVIVVGIIPFTGLPPRRKPGYLVPSNAVNHGGAKNIWLKLEKDTTKHTIEIVVEDDGTGCETVSNPSGSGIKNMQKRANTLGGELWLEPRVNGTGVRVVLSIPARE
ncbi:MAG: ATP-binding protein [Pseudomonadota bacterium]